MSHPNKSNSSGSSSKMYHTLPPTAPYPSIRQSHSFSSYPHPAPHSGYYYHAPGPYPPQPSSQHQLSPMPVHYGTHHSPPSAYHPYHYTAHHQYDDQHQQHRPDVAATSWPAPPASSSNIETMDTSNYHEESGTPSPPAIETTAAKSISGEKSPTSPIMDVTAGDADDVFAASALSSLANASTSPSSSPSPMTSSAGPLKKRRKMGKQLDTKDCSINGSPVHKVSETGTLEQKLSTTAAQFPSLLHKVLAKGESTNVDEDSTISSSLEWLNHGKGFRILRWDVFCTEVLPKEFPGLCVAIPNVAAKKDTIERGEEQNDAEKTSSEFSDEQWVEAFLFHVRSWGFEEVMSGRDRGSFRHQFFVKESPEQCSSMTRCSNKHAMVPLTPPPPPGPYGTEIGHSSSSLETPWRKSHNVSSIFKPRRTNSRGGDHESKMSNHPSHLHVPVLTSSATSSFAEAWGTEHRNTSAASNHHQHFPPPYGRSHKTIRFRDDHDPPFRQQDDAIEITPNPEASPKTSIRKHYGGFVSRRGRRPGLISRNSTH